MYIESKLVFYIFSNNLEEIVSLIFTKKKNTHKKTGTGYCKAIVIHIFTWLQICLLSLINHFFVPNWDVLVDSLENQHLTRSLKHFFLAPQLTSGWNRSLRWTGHCGRSRTDRGCVLPTRPAEGPGATLWPPVHIATRVRHGGRRRACVGTQPCEAVSGTLSATSPKTP